MPKYRIKSPDGKTYEVTAPDGASQDEVLAFAKKNYAPAADFSTVESEPAETVAPEADNAPETMGGQLAADTRSFVGGAANLIDAATAPVRVGLNAGLDKLGLPQQQGVAGLVDTVANKLGVPQNKPSIRTSAIEGVGGTLPTLGAGAAAKGAQGVAGAVGKVLAARPGIQVLSGATGAGGSEAAREAGAGPGLQALAGLAGGMAPGARLGGGRMAPTPALQDAVEAGAARGIPVRPIAAGGKATEVLRNLPLTGSANRYEKDVAKFNEAVAETIGAPKGTPLKQVYPKAVERAGKDYDKITSQYEFPVTPRAITQLATYRNTKPELGGAEPAAAQAIDEFLDEVAGLGTAQIPGALFKKLDSQLGKVPYKSESYGGLKALQDDLRQQYKAVMQPDDAALWDDVQRRYGDLKSVEKLYGDVTTTGEPIDPKKLLAALKGSRGGKTRLAKGTRGEMATLANVGRTITPPHTNKAILPIGTIAAAGTGALVPSSAPAIFTLAALSNLAGRAADKPFLTRALAALRQDKKSAAAAGAASGTGSQRKKKED